MLGQFFKIPLQSRNLIQLRTMAVVAKSLKYDKYGEPADVLNICEETLPDPKEDEVLVKVLAAPINPADINTIQGKYPVKPKLPAVGGNEFVAEVLCAGNKVQNIQEGDHVVPAIPGIGTWTSHAIHKAKNMLKIPKDIDLPSAATLTVNPCTAYRMLKDFVCVQKGETMIQNGGNSAVGQMVYQLCKAWDIQAIGVVRNKPNFEDVKNALKCLGATEVLTEEELRTTDIFKNKYKKPKLALNCIGGKSATELTRHLDNNGYLITYGGMSREPVIVGTAPFIFKDITLKGFWMTRWMHKNVDSEEKVKMFAELCQLIKDGKLQPPRHEMISLNKYKESMSSVLDMKRPPGRKFIIKFDDC